MDEITRLLSDQDGVIARRQVLAAGGSEATLRRIQYVELDGRLGHDTTPDRDRDLERDLDAAIEQAATVRLGYGQVFDRACSTAGKVGILLQHRGWDGSPTTCPACAAA